MLENELETIIYKLLTTSSTQARKRGLLNLPDSKIRVYRQFSMGENGVADMVLFSRNEIFIIELKRKAIVFDNYYQISKYLNFFIMKYKKKNIKKKVSGILIAPKINIKNNISPRIKIYKSDINPITGIFFHETH
ncbi:endonuclease NucS domain-containing protein [Photobacterium leiognathi]|uniref:endonuclease NucS domain-containing protein n=1 Tax=Photobacterium leiognathi TaxID=553611 RepID=UPI0029826A14|nr:endonuclease NucS domain-containing protein [Photobacterium leiognathi]